MPAGTGVDGRGSKEQVLVAQEGRAATPEPHQHAATAGQRLVFVDHVRVVLTILVILQHLALTYGAIGPWYYQEAVPQESLVQAVLTIFILINQAFFMGLFFLISAYFIPRSFDQKGFANFVKGRLIRLGMPLLIYSICLNPLAMLGFRFSVHDDSWLSSLPFWKFYLASLTPGPLWFVQTLLFLNIFYAVWRKFTRSQETRGFNDDNSLKYRDVIVFTLVLTATTFVVRIWIPIGVFIPVLDLPSASHFPQYISLFILGMVAYRRSWFTNTTDSMGRAGFGIAAVTTILLLPLTLSNVSTFGGGVHWQAFAYALWESVFCVGMCVGLLTFFRRRFNHQAALGRFLSTHAYTVYIIHAPIIVGIAFSMRDIDVAPLFKFALAALIAIPLCFWSASLIRRLPLARHIL